MQNLIEKVSRLRVAEYSRAALGRLSHGERAPRFAFQRVHFLIERSRGIFLLPTATLVSFPTYILTANFTSGPSHAAGGSL